MQEGKQTNDQNFLYYEHNKEVNMANVRRYTNKLLEKLENGELSWEEVCRECLSEMSESAVEDMCNTTEWVDCLDDDFEDEEAE